MKRSLSISALLVLAAASVAPPVFAADPEAIRQKLEKLKADREKAREAARANAAAQPTATATTAPPPTATAVPTVKPTATAVPTAVPPTSASATPPTSASAASVSPAAALALGLEQLRKTRPGRKHLEAGELRARWGDLAGSDPGKAELKQHAQRTAYLQRIRALGESRNDPKFVESVDKLITEEEHRNANAMNALRSPVAAPAPSGGK